MALNNGIYDIVNLGSTTRCAGAPPGSVDVGTPVMAVSPPLMLPIEVKRVGDDTYQFRLQMNSNIAIGYSERLFKDHFAFVKLMRSSMEVLWTISAGNSQGHFRIHIPNTDRCWTLPRGGGGLTPIVLSELAGTPEQDWIFQPLRS